MVGLRSMDQFVLAYHHLVSWIHFVDMESDISDDLLFSCSDWDPQFLANLFVESFDDNDHFLDASLDEDVDEEIEKIESKIY